MIETKINESNEDKTSTDEQVEVIDAQEKTPKKPSKAKHFFKFILDYLVKTSGGMALGLFATLIIGSIIGQVSELCGNPEWLKGIVSVLQGLMGAGIGVGVALSLKKLSPIAIISSGAVGAVSAYVRLFSDKANNNPLVVYLAVIAAIEVTRLILRKPTPVDILLVPLLMLGIGITVAYAIVWPLTWIMQQIGSFVAWATTQQPFVMGMLVAGVMGMCLTAPISSVAIAIMINLSGIAGGAALVGCCTQMVGFSIQSIYDNKAGKVIAVGIGTSMLQFPNIIKRPIIWVPTIVVSLILGPISSCVLQMECSAFGAGMGTCGLVGQFATITTMGVGSMNAWLGIVFLQILGPAILVFAIDFLFRKLKWIKKGDLAI